MAACSTLTSIFVQYLSWISTTTTYKAYIQIRSTDINMSTLPRSAIAKPSRISAPSKKKQSLRKSHFLTLIDNGLAKSVADVTIARMNRLEPNSTDNPICTPSRSASFDALRLANTSGAPAPNASNVTPASDSDN